jgi:hypothetical protein
MTNLALVGLLSFAFLVPHPAGAAELNVVNVSPARNSIAPATSSIRVTFDRAVKRSSVTAARLRVFGRATGTAGGTVTYTNGDTTLTFTPSTAFSAGEIVSVNLAHTLEATDGSLMRSAGHAFQFVVEAEPSLRSFTLVTAMSNRTVPSTNTRIYGAAATDLNEDGYLDLATVNEDSADIRVFLNTADGSGTFLQPFLAPVPIGVEASPNEMADFDNDGFTDLVVSATSTEDVWILRGNGDGTFATPQSIATGSQPHGVVALDVDGDADWDVVGANVGSNNLALMLNDGNGLLGSPTFFEGGVDGEYGLTTADMNADGIVDLIVAGRNGQHVNVMLGNGDGTFTAAGPAQSSGGLAWVVVAGDIDGDGNVDAAVANSVSGNVAILRGNGDGTLDAPEIIAVGAHVPSVDLGDLDGDGDLDLVLSSFGGGFWRMFVNDGTGAFAFDQEFSAPSNPSCSILYDADNDGDLDMALTDEIADVILLMENESVSACTAAPSSCREPTASAKASVSMRDRADPSQDTMSFKWTKGEATTKTDFGTPTAADAFALCIYDGSTLVYGADVRAGATNWRENTKGFKYRRKDGLPDGVTSLAFKEGTAGRASMKLKSKGARVAPPPLGTISGPLEVQLQRTDAGICLGATFSPPFVKLDLVDLKAKSD